VRKEERVLELLTEGFFFFCAFLNPVYLLKGIFFLENGFFIKYILKN
jgi:hypothetical protein